MLNYYSFGSGKAYIWLHGFLGNCLNLSSLARTIEGTHYLLDARNHGKSFHAPKMDFKTQSGDILTFMNTLKIEKASIIGHSMGGKTAMAFACNSSNRVEKLCVLDIAPLSYKNILDKYYGNIRQYLNFIKNLDIKHKNRKEIEALCEKEFNDIRISSLITSNLIVKDGNLEWRLGVDNLIEGLENVGGWDEPFSGFDGDVLAIAGGKSLHTCKSPLLTNGMELKDFYSKL